MTHLQAFQKELLGKADAALITSHQNQFYLSHFPFEDGFLLIFPEAAYLLTDFRYLEAAQKAVSDEFCVKAPDTGAFLEIGRLMEQHKVSTVCDDDPLPAGYEKIVNVEEDYPWNEPNKVCSDNGQLWRDTALQIGVIDTPRTKVTYGALGRGANCASHHWPKNKPVELDGMKVTCRTDFAVIAMSSLTDDAIEDSDNILLSTIGRARNTDAIFDGEKMLDVGRAPILAEVIDADISIRTKHGSKMKVWGVNAEGYYSGQIKTTYEDGMLSFHVGDENNPACYYLIVKE